MERKDSKNAGILIPPPGEKVFQTELLLATPPTPPLPPRQCHLSSLLEPESNNYLFASH